MRERAKRTNNSTETEGAAPFESQGLGLGFRTSFFYGEELGLEGSYGFSGCSEVRVFLVMVQLVEDFIGLGLVRVEFAGYSFR